MHRKALAAGVAVSAMLAGAAVGVPAATGAGANQPYQADSHAPAFGTGGFDVRSRFSPSGEGPSDPRGLPGDIENMEVVSRFSPTHPEHGAVQLGQIADVAVHKGHAYLNSWDDPDCRRGGTFVVDIRDPANPKQVAFIKAEFPFYHGEGAHAISVDVPGFKGDVLAVNNESYGSNVGLNDTPECNQDYDGDPQTPNSTAAGGFDLYDVTDPANPKPLVIGAGDNDANTPDDTTDDTPYANSYHSVFMWQAGPRAYVVASDNTELTDVDIFDVTDPTKPQEVADLDLAEAFPQILEGEEGNGSLVLHHDVIVKQIDGRFVMKADYWDAGYVQLDVTDPANPTYITDTRFSGEDPLRPGSQLTPEGNAHQGEFSFDNQFLLAADEDFSTSRPTVSAPTGPQPDKVVTGGGGNGVAISDLPDGTINGPSVFVGHACDAAGIPDAPADDGDPTTDDVALIERGGPGEGCFFVDKLDNAASKGWDAAVIFNQERPDDSAGGIDTAGSTIPTLLIRRVDALGAEGILSADATTPAVGTAGPEIEATETFDGWGYAHLYDAKTSERLDSYAIPESQDSRYAQDFGDLSIHEFATDPATNLAYAAYYAGGMRVFQFSRANGLVETGKYIADEGSNFWGVEQFTAPNGERLIAGSDRDFGLVILRYTGPGRVGPTPAPSPTPTPSPSPTATPTPPGDYYPGPGTSPGFTVKVGKYRRGRIVLRVTVERNGRFKANAFVKVLRKAGARKRRATRLDFVSQRLRDDGGTYRVVLKANKRVRRMIKRTRSRGTVRGAIKMRWDPSPGKVSRKTRKIRIPGS